MSTHYHLNIFSRFLWFGAFCKACYRRLTAFYLGRWRRSNGLKMWRDPPVAGVSGSNSRQVDMMFQGLSLFQSKSFIGPLG